MGRNVSRVMRALFAWLIALTTVLSVTVAGGMLSASGSPVQPSHGALTSAGSRASGGAVTRAAGMVTHDLDVRASNVTTLAGMQTTFSDGLSGATLQSTIWWWGDDTSTSTTSASVNHTYALPGIYLVYAEATDVTGGLHDNLQSLLRFAVLDSYTNDLLGNETQIQGSVLANQSSTSNAQAVIAPGGWIQVSNWITNLPNNPQWTLETPTYSLGSTARPYSNISTILGNGLNLSGATLSWTNSTPQGSYTLNFSVEDVNAELSPEGQTWNNFTFTVLVASSGATPLSPLPTSPHNGTLQVYQVQSVPPQSLTLDPAFAEDPTDGPILQNFYQTLVVYNGSQAGPNPSDFVPDLATCVPGSALCDDLYGSSMVSGYNWTFVINPNATFYNGTTGSTRNVYPNDVAFSLARSCLMANSVSGYEDYQLCQVLLPHNANGSWDGGLHSPWNNTPAQILGAISLNNSLYCTAEMQDGVHGHGCITIDSSASERAWPEFLEFFASTVGAAIISCDWAASEGLGLPGWTDGSTCYPAPPGSSGNPNPPPADTAWDSYEETNGFSGIPTNPLRFHAVGSGPYYLTGFNNTTGYTLSASPDWGGTTCQGGVLEGCLPDATLGGHTPSYIPKVVVHFELSNGPGLSALATGNADLVDTTGGGGNAGYGGNGSTILAEVQAGELDYIVGPSITEDYAFTEPEFNESAASSALGSAVTLPSDAFQDLNFRQFLITSYPHLITMQNACIVGGILYCFSSGGAIPVGIGSYYPTNISWPLTDANPNPQDVGGAAWWWSQVEADSIVGSTCTAASPCTFPLPAGNSQQSLDFQGWANAMDSISGGAIQASVVNVSYDDMVLSTFYSAFGNATFPVGDYGWAPDYFDPSDYADPFYLADGYIAQPTYLPNYLFQPQYSATCSGPSSDPTVTTACQGTAYAELNSLVQSADTCAPPSCSASQRALLYNMAERVAYGLGLYTILYQQAAVYAFAPWIDGSSLLQNPDRNNVYGGTTSDQPFFLIQYATGIPQGHSLEVYLESPGAASSGSLPLGGLAHGRSAQVGASLSVEAGQTFITLVSVTGGTGTYHYIWSGLPTGCATLDTAVISCTPSQGGSNVSMSVTVVDSGGNRGQSGVLDLQVIVHVTIDLFDAHPANVTLGQSVLFSISASGGIGALSYAYLGLPTGCTSVDSATLNCTPNTAGHFSVTAAATDTVGIQAYATTGVNVTVLTPPPAPSSHPSTFLGLPGIEGYIVLAGIALVLLLAGVGYWSGRLRRSTATARTGAAESSKPPSRLTCPACGAANQVGAKYCDQCAKPLLP